MPPSPALWALPERQPARALLCQWTSPSPPPTHTQGQPSQQGGWGSQAWSAQMLSPLLLQLRLTCPSSARKGVRALGPRKGVEGDQVSFNTSPLACRRRRRIHKSQKKHRRMAEDQQKMGRSSWVAQLKNFHLYSTGKQSKLVSPEQLYKITSSASLLLWAPHPLRIQEESPHFMGKSFERSSSLQAQTAKPSFLSFRF